jgi:hypothetical protein
VSEPVENEAWQEIEELLVTMETHQVSKVFTLARRLKPGITHEDMRNPHDFPELADNDWHFEDGILTGIQTVLSAVRARRRDTRHSSENATATEESAP